MEQGKAPLGGKVAVVTGGSSGIGAAAARHLAASGASVVVGYYRGEARARALLAELPPGPHRAVRVALEETPSLTDLAREVTEVYGRADILVNSAGFTRPVPHRDLDALDDVTFDAILTANVRGVFATIRALLPALRAAGRAVIVNVSSIAGFTGAGSSIAYAASKGALDTMSLSLARALGPEIRVLTVSPGAVDTGFVPGRTRAALDKLAAASPLQAVVGPDDVAQAIMACVTLLPLSTGARIVVDGGSHL